MNYFFYFIALQRCELQTYYIPTMQTSDPYIFDILKFIERGFPNRNESKMKKSWHVKAA